MRSLLSIALLWLCAVPVPAQPPKDDGKAIADMIAPFVDEQTVAVIHIAPQRIEPAALSRILLRSNVDEKEKQELTDEIRRWKEGCEKLGTQDIFVLFSLADWDAPIAFVVLLDPSKADAKAAMRLVEPLAGQTRLESAILGKVSIIGSKLMVERLKSIKPVARLELATALKAIGDNDFQAVITPTRDQRKVTLELLALATRSKESEVLKAWVGGTQWLAAGARLTPKVALKVRVQAENNAAAKSLAERIPDLLKLIGHQFTGTPQERLGDALTVNVVDNQAHASLANENQKRALSEFVASAVESFRRQRYAKALTHVALAFHRYWQSNRGLYPGWAYYGEVKLDTTDSRVSRESPFTRPSKDAKPLLSWRVMILPYLGYGDLFRRFKLNEPWDSEHNKKLIPEMPPEYGRRESQLSRRGKTRILAPVGPRTIFSPDGEPIYAYKVSDGLANTILLVEASDDSAVVWTKPSDWVFDSGAANPAKGLLNPGSDGFVAVWAGGQVGTVSKKQIESISFPLLFIRDSNEVKRVPNRTRGFWPPPK